MDVDQELLQRYWLGQCTNAERKQVEDWLEAGEPQQEYPINGRIDADRSELEAWGALEHKIGGVPPYAVRRLTRLRWPLIGIAASLIAMILIGYQWILKPRLEGAIPIAEYQTATAPMGSKLTITLPDRTVVHLNAGSNLRYPARFSGSIRKVLLEGEGFFNVSANPEQPFIVETPHSTTEVLGTRFNLRDFSGEFQRSIVVEEGRVRYAANGDDVGVILHAHDRAIYGPDGMVRDQVNSSDYTDWKDGILRFADIPLAEAIPMIERWYGVRIRLSDPSLAGINIKASFRNATLHHVLDDVGYLLNVRYQLKNNEAVIYPSTP